MVRSKAEQKIDDWLYENGIVHAYEAPVGSDRCDFMVPTKEGNMTNRTMTPRLLTSAATIALAAVAAPVLAQDATATASTTSGSSGRPDHS